MADSVSLRAFAKINLCIDITGVSPDEKYHTVEMVMQSIGLYDTITVSKADDINIKCSTSAPSDETNIAYVAAKAFFEFAEIDGGASIKIKKRIPVCAGLGGGSSDAAAVICALNELYHTNFDDEDLCKIAEQVGSDVPFFIIGGTVLAEGRGTILTPLPDLMPCAFVVIKDGHKPSTGQMYSQYDSLENVEHPQTQQVVENVCEGDFDTLCQNMDNVFELLYPQEILAQKQELLQVGASCALLSGSGPSVFGVFKDLDDAKRAKDELLQYHEDVFVCEPTKSGYEFI